MVIRPFEDSDRSRWDEYVSAHPDATPWHLIGWKTAFETAYGHKGYYFVAQEGQTIQGVLPLFHIKSRLFGSSLTSMPFLDAGGALADDDGVETELLDEAVRLGRRLKTDIFELRLIRRPAWAQEERFGGFGSRNDSSHLSFWSINSEKVRMLLSLPPDPQMLMDSFKSKLRSQIRKSIKEGCISVMGGMELLDDFYRVFSINMRDLGSPVHSRMLFALVLRLFPQRARICLVRKDKAALAGSLVIGLNNTLSNPWASSLRRYSQLSPNMLLYWSVLKYGCENGFSRFDFGRSTPGEGTCLFKEQWGAKPSQLNWVSTRLSGKGVSTTRSNKSVFSTVVHYWKRLPVPITLLLGPPVRRQINL